MDDDFIQDDFYSALCVALDTLEELDPTTKNKPWFQLLEKTMSKTLAPKFEEAMNPTKH